MKATQPRKRLGEAGERGPLRIGSRARASVYGIIRGCDIIITSASANGSVSRDDGPSAKGREDATASDPPSGRFRFASRGFGLTSRRRS